MAVFGDNLYAGTRTASGGCEIHAYNKSSDSWWPVMGVNANNPSISPGFGDANNTRAASMVVYNDYLYVGTGNYVGACQIWRSSNAKDWEQVIGQGAVGSLTAPRVRGQQ